MTTGIILAVLSIVLLSKFLTKRAKGNKLDKLMIRIHKPVGVLLIIVGIIHLILTWSLRKQRPVSMFILGFIMIGCAFLLFISYLFRKMLKKKWIILHRVLSLVLFICLIVHTIIGFSSFSEYKEMVGSIEINEIDLNDVEDGTYIGTYDVGYIYVQVEVEVRENTIASIQLLEHRNERGSAAAEVITDSIIKEQSLKVDAVSSATNSSKVILKAIENALEGIENE